MHNLLNAENGKKTLTYEEAIELKIQWYKDSSQELLDQCEVEREGMLLDIDANDRDLKKINNSKIQLQD